MRFNEFNDNYLHLLLQKNPKEKKNVSLLGDFNVDLLKYDKHETNEFIDSLSCHTRMGRNTFIILHPTRVTGHLQTITYNIFSNYVSKAAVPGNLTSTISDHLPQVSLYLLCSQTILFQNPTFLKEAGQTLIKLNLT